MRPSMTVPASADNGGMLVAADIPDIAAFERIEDLPGGSGGIPMEDRKRELCEKVQASSVTILDAATATGQLLDPIAGQK